MSRKETRDLRKEKKARKRKWLKTQSSSGPAKVQIGTVASEGDDDDDWDDLAREERMAKKVRTGDISQKTFNAEFTDL